MLLSPPHRESFSIPVRINLRRRRTRGIQLDPTTAPELKRRRNSNAEKTKALALVSSVGEERALLLGCTMMAFSILMYFVVGIVVVKPFIHSDWGDAINCSLIQAEFLNESANWEGLSSYPCLQVTVNITASGRTIRLRYDEAAVILSTECFYTPKNQENKSDLMEEAQKIKDFLSQLQGQALTCHLSSERYPEDAILRKRHDLNVALRCLLWPSLMLAGGVLLIGLVKLTQYLAHLSARMSQEVGENELRNPGKIKLYQMMRCRPSNYSMDEEEESDC